MFPATLLFLCLFNIFDLWTKLMVCLGFEDFTFAGVADEGKVQEGKQIARIGKCLSEK